MPHVPAVALGPDPGLSAATPAPRSPRPAPPVVPNDFGIRLFGIPFLGIVIPHLTGLFGPFGPRSPTFWLGCLWFTLIAGLLWEGNRFFFVRQRRHADGPDRRWRKLAVLLAFNVLYSAPVALVMLLAWYRFAGLEAKEAAGVTSDGARRRVAVMLRDSRRFAGTGGWGFEVFKGDGTEGSLDAEGRAACFACHTKGRDCVFSEFRLAGR
jgi:Cytochrome P460